MIIMMVLGCSGIVYITITVSKYMKVALAEEETAAIERARLFATGDMTNINTLSGNKKK